MPPISSLVLSLGAMRKRDWMVRDVMKKIVCGSKCRTGYAMATTAEQVERHCHGGGLPAVAQRGVSCWKSACGTSVPVRYGWESCEKCSSPSRFATAGNRVRSAPEVL